MAENDGVKMKIATTRFGEIERGEEEVYTFPDGLLGFRLVKRFVLVDNPKPGPFLWLQAADVPDLAFVVTDPLLFKQDYIIKVQQIELESIKLANIEDARVLVIVVVPRNVREMTANLQGPLVFNTKENLAKQLVLQGDEYTTKYRVFQDDAGGNASGTDGSGADDSGRTEQGG